MGSDEKYGVGPGCLSRQGSKNVNKETASPREVWAVVLPVPGRGDEGGGDRAHLDIDPPEAEHGRAIYCDAANSGMCKWAVRRPGSRVPRRWWEQTGIEWKGVREKAAETEEAAEPALTGSDSESKADTPDGTASGMGEEASLGASGSSGAEWIGAED